MNIIKALTGDDVNDALEYLNRIHVRSRFGWARMSEITSTPRLRNFLTKSHNLALVARSSENYIVAVLLARVVEHPFVDLRGGELLCLHVEPTYRKSMISAQLSSELIHWASKNALCEVFSLYEMDNEINSRSNFLTRLGFVEAEKCYTLLIT